MKLWFAIFFVLSCLGFSYASKFKLDEPPFYTMTFEEIQDVPAKHKETYLNRLVQLFRQLKARPGQKVTGIKSAESLDELTSDKDRWNKMREETFLICQSVPNTKICSDLLELRRKIFYINAGSHDGTYGSGER